MEIGAISGFLTVYAVLIGLQVLVIGPGVMVSSFAVIDAFFGLIGVPIGIVGALIGKYWLRTQKAAWAGGFMCVGLVFLFIIIMSGGLSGLCFILGGS